MAVNSPKRCKSKKKSPGAARRETRAPRLGKNLRRQGVKCLFVLAEEVVVGSVRHEPLVTDISGLPAAVGVVGGRSSVGVQALDEGGFRHDFAARWPLLRTN